MPKQPDRKTDDLTDVERQKVSSISTRSLSHMRSGPSNPRDEKIKQSASAGCSATDRTAGYTRLENGRKS